MPTVDIIITHTSERDSDEQGGRAGRAVVAAAAAVLLCRYYLNCMYVSVFLNMIVSHTGTGTSGRHGTA